MRTNQSKEKEPNLYSSCLMHHLIIDKIRCIDKDAAGLRERHSEVADGEHSSCCRFKGSLLLSLHTRLSTIYYLLLSITTAVYTMSLNAASYGKDNVRVCKVHRDQQTGIQTVVEMTICVLLEGEIDVS